MSERYCKCGHAESNHHDGMCNGQVMKETPKMVLCDCKQFERKAKEDFSQAAAEIARKATERDS